MTSQTIRIRNVCTISVIALLKLAACFCYPADLRITSIRITNNDVRLNWNAPGGNNYVLQSVTPLGTNFANLGPTSFVSIGPDQPLSFVHTGAATSALSRFYRVRAFPPPRLEIQPTNALIGVGMTNRYKVVTVAADNSVQDVTTSASLSITSLNTSVAQFVRITNGFVFVRGITAGTASLRAVFQGMTNTAPLTISPLTGVFTVPPLSQINGYVQGSPTAVQVFGIFANGATNNITAASNLQGQNGNLVGTRVDYIVGASVANSLALITGQSAALEPVFFSAGGFSSSSINVNWCWFTGISLVPDNARINIGATQQFTVVGYMANGVVTNALSVVGGSPVFSSTDSGIAQALSGLRVAGRTNGRTTINISLDNGPGNWCSGGIAGCTTLEVGTPTNSAGNVDKTFNFCAGTSGSVGYPYAVATQPNGRIVIGGPFLSANGISSPGIQRLLPDGNVDPTFRRSVTGSDRLYRIVVQPDGRILVAQVFHQGSAVGMVRLNADGSLDDTFATVSATNASGFNEDIYAMTLQPNGRILIGGTFTAINGIPRNRVARIHGNGSLDETFNVGAGPNAEVRALATDSLGRIYIGGNFTNVNGIVRMRIARLTSQGAVDTEFEPSTGANDSVLAIVVRETGPWPVLVGGAFTTMRGLSSLRLAALETNGLLAPPPFATPAAANIVRALALQPDGKVVWASDGGLSRLTTSNSVDTSFIIPGGVDGSVLGISTHTNAMIDIVGAFSRVGGWSRRNVARLLQSTP